MNLDEVVRDVTERQGGGVILNLSREKALVKRV
jgi:hypothetical protein